jgi:hypothetical protein
MLSPVKHSASVSLPLLQHEIVPFSILYSFFLYPIILFALQHLAPDWDSSCLLPLDRCSSLYDADGSSCLTNESV